MRYDITGNKEAVDKITSQIWSCVDVFRGSFNDSRLYVILYLVSVYKDGLLENLSVTNPNEILYAFRNRIASNRFYSTLDNIYQPILNILNFYLII